MPMTTSQVIAALRQMDPTGQALVGIAIPWGYDGVAEDAATIAGLRRRPPGWPVPIEIFSMDALGGDDVARAKRTLESKEYFVEVLWGDCPAEAKADTGAGSALASAEYVSGPYGPESGGTCACAVPGCPGKVDVPPGTLDGAAVHCWVCAREHAVVAYPDGSWTLHACPNLEAGEGA